jgi:UDP-N-acetylmuramoyl-tripeptide--D-alanyl-D-alanine ligase
VIINIGTMHIENLGSRDGILQAKMEIISGMQENGQLILNGDDALLQTVYQNTAYPITYFGAQNTACHVCGYNVQSENNRISFGVRKNEKVCSIQLALDGEHYVPDALAAVSVGLHFGVGEQEIEKSLASFRNMEGRQEILQAKGCTIIKDYYNAGPESMAAALKVLGNKSGRRIAVLGDMLELGVCAEAEHYRIGRIAVEHADVILAYGPNGGRVVTGAITGGKSPERARFFEDKQELVRTLCHLAQPGDVILIKGSHGMHMEEVLDGFLNDKAHTAEDAL